MDAQWTVMVKSPPYEVDRQESSLRAIALQAYLSRHVAKTRLEKMVCASYSDCYGSAMKASASFHEAQGHAVGRSYDLSKADGTPFRVLVVPMEAGGGDSFASVAGRTARVRASGALPFNKRNPHMQGVALALRLAMGMPYKDRQGQPFTKIEDEQVSFTDGTHDHLFECFAMANLLLCSAVAKPGSQASKANGTMRSNCARHLVKTIGILQPTLVISQGVTLVDTLWGSLGVQKQVDLNGPDCYLTDCELHGDKYVWLALKHPSRLWRSINQPYFTDTVVPATKAARTRALKLASKV